MAEKLQVSPTAKFAISKGQTQNINSVFRKLDDQQKITFVQNVEIQLTGIMSQHLIKQM